MSLVGAGFKLTVFCILLVSLVAQAKTVITKQSFNQLDDGTPVEIYTLRSGKIEARITTYGGIIVSLRVPDRKGNPDDVVLGYDSLSQYVAKNPYFGAIIGRYGNRIAHGSFTLDGKTYSVSKNDGGNSLHGGTRGFDKVVWKAKPIKDGIELTYVSKDGDQGYPGTLTATVRYTLSEDALHIEYFATTDKATVVNLTNHSYFNLAGQGKDTILQHQLKINASHFTPVDSTLIPTGELKSVEGTPFDFRTSTAIGQSIDAADDQLVKGKGYDHNWVLDKTPGKFNEAAELYEPVTGRVLQVLTTELGLQFYSGNFLNGTITGKQGRVYPKRSGLCLETQHFPDSPNHPNFPSTELKPGERYHTVTVLKFSTRSEPGSK
ncbi:MAG TPA: aldose epimerase family protein [Terriglobales bacterium]|jgi:aldose 1-epimerase|nr:aldose epimerase family protein [Terriglobales bacterium]